MDLKCLLVPCLKIDDFQLVVKKESMIYLKTTLLMLMTIRSDM